MSRIAETALSDRHDHQHGGGVTDPGGECTHRVAVTPDGTKVYVANEFTNTVSVIDTATTTVVATVPVGGFPLGIEDR